MAHEKISSPLVVEKSEIVLVKPSKPTPEVSLSLSTFDNDPFSEIIIQTLCVYAPKPNQTEDPAYLFEQALSNALVFYYPLAGKLRRKSEDNRLELKCTAGDGVPFIRATAECTLSSLNYLEDVGDEAYQLVHCYEPVKGSEGYDPLALQITKFSCGGIAIGMTFSHAVCDGVGAAKFFRTIMEFASGRNEPSVIPVWERERLIHENKEEFEEDNQTQKLIESLKASSSVATSPYTLTENMVRESLKITSKDITKLKKIISEEEQITKEKANKNACAGVTTFEIIAALMWKAKCRALKLNPDGTTILAIGVGVGSILEPPLPEGYYGNAIVSAFVTLSAKELSESPLSRVVWLIKNMKRVALDKRLKEKTSFEGYNSGFMTLSDWRNIGLHYNGWGGLVNIIPLNPMSFSFTCVLLPTSEAVHGSSGDHRLVVTLPRDAMDKFKEEMNAF